MILDYQANALITVETIEKGMWRISSRYDDTLFSAEVVLMVKAPALDIREARLELHRDVLGMAPDLSEAERDLVGVRVGPGMTKIVRGILEKAPRIAELVLESMEMLVNALTVPELRKAMQTGGEFIKLDSDGPKIYLNDILINEEMIEILGRNPRLKGSCAAFKI